MTSQLMFLNKILETKNFSVIDTNNLDDSYFFNYSNEFSFIKNHYERYHAVPDVLTFTSNFPDFDIVKVSEPDSFLINQLIEDRMGNFLATQFNTVKKYLEGNDITKAKDIFNKAAQAMTQMRTTAAVPCSDLMSDLSRFERYEERCRPGNNLYYSTGLKELDDAIGGIDRENENMVIIARTGIGKTWTLLKMAAASVRAGRRVGFYSGEMSKDKVGLRFDTLFGGVDNWAITRGDISVASEYRNYIEDIKDGVIKGGPFFVLTPEDLGAQAKVSDLKAFINDKKLDILFVDQYSLLVDESGARAENEKIANISKAIKNLQVLSKIPIISVSQQNRSKNDDGTIDTTMVFGSDRIGQDSTVLIAIDKKMEPRPDGQGKITKFIFNLLKVRDGAMTDKVSYIVDLNHGTFTYLPENADMPQAAADDIADSYDEDQPW